MGIKQLFENDKRILKRYGKTADKIDALEQSMSALNDDELKAKTTEFQERYKQGETLDDLLVEAFAAVREGARRVLGMFPYRVQIQGGIALHEGNIAEMKTGEGKTLTATMPVYLNALSGEGVHVVTVNDYLATRDAEEMGELYRWMGLSVGLNKNGLPPSEKRVAYHSDITYSTNSELGFDYLRDNMVQSKSQLVQRPLSFAVIDEVDSILIDEARTPLIISGQASQTNSLYQRADFFVKSLTAEKHYTVDIESKTVSMTEEGIDKAEATFRTPNLYDSENQTLLHHIEKALQANYIMFCDKDYVVDEDEVKIVDQFTGRIMEGRRYSDGLHQAIEAKEGVTLQKESRTVANITYQNFFRMYKKLSGMTGTGKTEEDEFREIYNMNVVVIPTNRPIAREDRADLLYPTLKGKYKAVVKEIKERHAKGQPVLVGTVAVETSELLGRMLIKEGVPHEVLNAKNHFREAEIIVNAGQKGSVTIATNMAGRGTDIKLGQGVKELGGLAVIGTERHESRRIDNQLRGRSGRQGDPGVSQFYLSLEDELMQRFGADRIKNMMSALVGEEDMPLQSRLFTKQVASAQERVEGNNYDARKSVLKYDDVMREQREIMYRDRYKVIEAEDTSGIVEPIKRRVISRNVDMHTQSANKEHWNLQAILEFADRILNIGEEVSIAGLKGKSAEEIKTMLYDKVKATYDEKLEVLPFKEQHTAFEKTVLLRVVDKLWTDHIDYMDSLREGIGLRSYAQKDPTVEYQEEAFDAFNDLIAKLETEVTRLLMRSTFRQNLQQRSA